MKTDKEKFEDLMREFGVEFECDVNSNYIRHAVVVNTPNGDYGACFDFNKEDGSFHSVQYGGY